MGVGVEGLGQTITTSVTSLEDKNKDWQQKVNQITMSQSLLVKL
jgi:hypothetical protein